jgi:hypothetical protein
MRELAKRQDVIEQPKLEQPNFDGARSFEEEFADWIRRAREAGYEFRLSSWEIQFEPYLNDRINIRMNVAGFRGRPW